MNNPPSKEELIISIINFLENDIISELKGQKRFHAHVAKNSLNIVLRQLRLEKENNSKEKKRLKEILKIEGNLKDLNQILCEKINNEEIDINNDELIDHLYKTTMEKLSIDQPNYSGYLAEKK
ncbi:MAG: DUF6285 domain-containing protein [Pseudomonadota bacterium]|mgnify:FL=1|nr:DUF6285 domain-containing protein [Pseudomonadota bacterium]MEC8797541.1 DUF6285 domain-containing protein [Pseudomonadota bacterium]|tara:strand:- start:10367 stop:10735 length:369 start_codon:yes stop_codon:yes gene_type:complete